MAEMPQFQLLAQLADDLDRLLNLGIPWETILCASHRKRKVPSRIIRLYYGLGKLIGEYGLTESQIRAAEPIALRIRNLPDYVVDLLIQKIKSGSKPREIQKFISIWDKIPKSKETNQKASSNDDDSHQEAN